MKKVLFLIVSALILALLFTGCRDIAKITDPITVNDVYGTDGNVYKCATCVHSDSATGKGLPIKPKGTWFMYNQYSDGYVGTYDIQAGNPKGGENIIGYYWIEDNGDGSYTAKYYIDGTFVVVDEHLAISDSPNFTAAPGRDDNADFYVPFEAETPFYIFAHFAVECK